MEFKKGQKIYYIRKVVDKDCYDLHECKVRSQYGNHIVILDKHTKTAFLINAKWYGELFFTNRGDALNKIFELEGQI